MHAIVIDDDPVTRMMLQGQLDAMGFSSEAAGDAEQGMDKVRAGRPDLCLVDWIMPGMHGTDLVRAIRNDPKMASTYVIMATTMSRIEDLATAFEAGVDDFIRKPVHPMELSSRLRAAQRLIEHRNELTQSTRLISDLNDELVEMNAQLKQMATTDTLTGLSNRSVALDGLDMAWAEWKRSATPFAAAVLDVDHFKQVNDTYGHAAGDEALRHIARLLADHQRDGVYVGRYGGEEFILSYTHSAPGAAHAHADRLRQAIADAPVTFEGQTIPLTASIGVAEVGPETKNIVQLISDADSALYTAKESGRNRVVMHEPAARS